MAVEKQGIERGKIWGSHGEIKGRFSEGGDQIGIESTISSWDVSRSR
jgi:hypothetical protein